MGHGEGVCELVEMDDLKDVEIFLFGPLAGEPHDTPVKIHKM